MSGHAIEGYARGWFAVCFSEELPAGTTRPLRYFGQDLAAYRGEDGQVRILEAHCAHMGAHLAVGGTVVGNKIVCPFHGWCFDGEGHCVEIPYSKKIPPRAQQKTWRAQDRNGLTWLYFDPSGAAPPFDVPVLPSYGSEDWLPWNTSTYHIKTHPREIVDNLADRAHFRTVHRTEINEFDFSTDGFTATQFAKGTSYLPGGGTDNFASTTTYHGPGILLMNFDGALKNVMLFVHTPVDENNVDLRLLLTLKIVGSKEKTEGIVKSYMDNLRSGFEDDIRIWEHKIYRDPAMLCEGDGPIGKLRKWYRQFYGPPQQGGLSRPPSLGTAE